MFRFVDLFCGIGGFHQALSSLGGECVWASDIDESCRKVYLDNYGILPEGDITKVEERDIPEHDVLCGGFPCQSFSKAGKRLGFKDTTKGTLFFDIMRIAKFHQPKYLLLENVRNLASHDGGNTWKTIKEVIEECGYNTTQEPIIFSPHYIGIPQHRERVFILCKRKDLGEVPPFVFKKEDIVPCSIDSILQDDEEIENLERYTLDEKTVEWIDLWNEFLQGIEWKRGLPGFPIWTECFKEHDGESEEFKSLPSWKRNFVLKNEMLYSENKEFVDRWLEKARRNPMFFGAKAKLEWQAGNVDKPDLWKTIMQIRPSGLRAKRGDYFPALVAITQTSIVGKRRRYLTPRECARLQSFPNDFKIGNDKEAYRQLGNSVNVEVVRFFAKYLLDIR